MITIELPGADSLKSLHAALSRTRYSEIPVTCHLTNSLIIFELDAHQRHRLAL